VFGRRRRRRRALIVFVFRVAQFYYSRENAL